uniref:Ribosomal protein L14 n=1 Tax=Capsaspora owczarzaki TaxID=192875 RepID=M1K4L6_9EUKA|nr:ribosomal protein L14 [Capsaspora owczarzaki]
MQLKSKCLVADNSGVIQVECIQVKNKKNVANIGDIIKIAVKSVLPTSKIKKGAVKNGLVIKSKIGTKFKDGSRIQFGDYEVILVERGIKGKGWVPVSNRSSGLVPYWITSTQLKTLFNWPFPKEIIK